MNELQRYHEHVSTVHSLDVKTCTKGEKIKELINIPTGGNTKGNLEGNQFGEVTGSKVFKGDET